MRKRKNGGYIIVYVILISGIIITILPFLWMILTSLKTQSEAVQIPITIFPKNWKFGNYPAVFEKVPYLQMYFNTIISSVITVVVQVIFCSMAAYAFARIKFPGRDIIFYFLLAVLMIPSSFFILPQYLIIQKMGLLNTVYALFIPKLFSAFGTFLLRQFFMALPNELEDAARLDGCNHFKIYLKIMLPLVKAGLVSMVIITFKYAWNDLMWPLIVNNTPEKMTLSAGLSYLQGQFMTDYPVMMAGAVMAVLPLLVLFVFFQNQFIEGVAASGIKG